MHKKKRQKNKKLRMILWVTVLAVVLLVGGYVGVKHFYGKAVNVYPASDVIDNYSWMNSSEAEGTVTTDKIQSVYVSSTQQVTEVYVEEGQTIHVGDPILAFDTTLSELELQRQAIKVEQLKLDIQDAEDQLKEIDTYRVGSASSVSYSSYVGTTSGGGNLTSVYVPYLQTADGLGTASDPLVYLWDDNCVFDQSFIQAAVQTAMDNRNAASQTIAPVLPEEPDEPDVTEPTEPDVTEPEEPGDAAQPEQPDISDDSDDGQLPEDPDETVQPDETEEPEQTTEPEDSDPSDESDELDDPRVFVVFEVRDSNALGGDLLRNWEMVMLLDESGDWAVNLVAPDYDVGDDSGSGYDDYYSGYVYDDTVYYTASEIAQMKSECNQKLKDLNLELKMAELEYDRLSYELSSGEVVSKIDGVVKTVRDVDEARQENKPVVLISGGGGYYVTSVLGELDLDTVQVGDTVTVMSWESYSQVEGTVVEISPYPDESGQYWYSNQGNQNVSLYPFKVFVDEDADLREGEYVEITFTSGDDDSGGQYLTGAFVRQENGKSYVYVVGSDGTLEKRFIKTGSIIWGSEYEILSGLSEDDYIAFPYGRNVEEGAKVQYADIDELYSYYY